MITSKKIIKKIFLWIIINSAFSITIFIFLAVNSDSPRIILFLRVLLMTYVISSFSVLTGYSVAYFMKERPLIIEIPAVLGAVLCVTAACHMICYHLIKNFFNFPVFKSRIEQLILLLVISATVSIITMTIEHLKKKKDGLENDLYYIKAKKENEHALKSITIKTSDGFYRINCDDLIYLASHGKKTTLHTIENDYVVTDLLKYIENKLPREKFIRIHRQFVVNMTYISKVKYFEGGRYMAYLKDEDQSALPIGRKNAPVLKDKLGI